MIPEFAQVWFLGSRFRARPVVSRAVRVERLVYRLCVPSG